MRGANTNATWPLVIALRGAGPAAVLRAPDLRWSPGATRHVVEAAEFLLPPR